MMTTAPAGTVAVGGSSVAVAVGVGASVGVTVAVLVGAGVEVSVGDTVAVAREVGVDDAFSGSAVLVIVGSGDAGSAGLVAVRSSTVGAGSEPAHPANAIRMTTANGNQIKSLVSFGQRRAKLRLRLACHVDDRRVMGTKRTDAAGQQPQPERQRTADSQKSKLATDPAAG
jgi:hypothetical protein